MSNNNEQITTSGIGLSVLLTIIFVILKLTHTVDWAWLWIFSPLWIAAGLGVIIAIILFIIIAIVHKDW